MGCHPIQELLSGAADRLVKVYALKINPKTHQRKKNLLDQLQKRGVPIEYVSKEVLERYLGSSSHQGIAAQIKRKSPITIESLLNQKQRPEILLALDEIQDPHNLGAILRASECFSVGGVIWSKNRGAQLSAVVAKSSSAASELVPTVLVSNLRTALMKLKQEGYTLLSAEISPNAKSLFEYEFPKHSVLILGSEGKGVRKILSDLTDQALYIPMYGKIDSLNVSQAAAVFLSHMKKSLIE